MTTLARWRQSQTGELQKKRRPYLASECDDLKECEKWRLEIIREISRKVTQVQNAGLGEFRLRDLNDEINKLLREKRHWEFRCAELGGINYRKRFGPKFDFAGKEVPGNRGYKYFGAAKGRRSRLTLSIELSFTLSKVPLTIFYPPNIRSSRGARTVRNRTTITSAKITRRTDAERGRRLLRVPRRG